MKYMEICDLESTIFEKFLKSNTLENFKYAYWYVFH